MSFSIRSVVRIAAVAVAAVIVGNILWWITGGGTDLLNIVNIESENTPIATRHEFNVSQQLTQVRTPVPTPSMTRIVRDTPTATPPNPKEQGAKDSKLIKGTINPVLEVDRYVFSGDADDRVLVRMVRTSGDLSPQFRVYHPDGTSLCSSLVTNSTLVERECGLAVSGTYSILVSDEVGTQTGDYTLTINYLNHPSAVFVELGKPVIGDIASGTEMDQLSFQGQEGFGILVRMVRTSGDLSPQFRVYRPGGTLLCDSLAKNFALVERDCALDVSGTYSILVSDYGGIQKGAYALSIQRSN